MKKGKLGRRSAWLMGMLGIIGTLILSGWPGYLLAEVIDGASTGDLPVRPYQIFTLRLPDGNCHPNPEFPQNPCPEDNLPVGVPDFPVLGNFFFMLGIFDTGSAFVAIDNVTGEPTVDNPYPLYSTAHALDLCGPDPVDPYDPSPPSNFRTDCSGPFFPPGDSTGRSNDPFIPEALDVLAWGMAVVQSSGGIFEETFDNPQGLTQGIRVRVTGNKVPLRKSLIGAPLANQVLAHIDFANPVTRDIFGFPGSEGADMEFFLPGDADIPDSLFDVDLVPFGDTDPGYFDGATQDRRFFLGNFTLKNGTKELSAGDSIPGSPASAARALFDTGNPKTTITPAAAAALGMVLPATCALPNCVELAGLKCLKIDKFEMTASDGPCKYVIDGPFVCVDEATTSFTGISNPDEASDVIFGMNFVAETQILFDGPGSRLGMFLGQCEELDTTLPNCELTAEISGPPELIEITVQDNESGLSSIDVSVANNAVVTVPSFTIGTNDPVVISAESIDQDAESEVELEITDMAGNVTVCAHIFNEQVAAPCDIDGDADVDIQDIINIFSSIGQTVAPGDPRDKDGDGFITIIDARGCVLECTNPGCAP